ncbi:MAG: GNAT family N-acetyltransferase [Candidatus Fervidibacter sacchari]
MGGKVVLITNLQQWAKWRDAWDDLLSNSTAFEARIFLSYEWLTTWWRFFGCGAQSAGWDLGRKLLVVAVADGERLLAAAPLFVSPSPILPFVRIVRFIGNGNADYGDFLVRKGCEEVAQRIWLWLFAHTSLWHSIALHELPEGSEAISSLQRVNLPDGFRATILVGEVCHRVPLNSENGSWRERASKSLREQLKRRERQIWRNFKVQFRTATNCREVETMLPQLFALHRLRWGQLGQTGVFIFPKVRKFHQEFAQQALNRHWLRLHWLTLDNVTAAVYYAFKVGNYSGFYTCGFNPSFGRYSVGKVLLAKVIDEAEREGAKVFDFMRGDETYKAGFGTVTQRNFHLFVWRNGEPLSIAAASLHRFTTWLSLSLKRTAQR